MISSIQIQIHKSRCFFYLLTIFHWICPSNQQSFVRENSMELISWIVNMLKFVKWHLVNIFHNEVKMTCECIFRSWYFLFLKENFEWSFIIKYMTIWSKISWSCQGISWSEVLNLWYERFFAPSTYSPPCNCHYRCCAIDFRRISRKNTLQNALRHLLFSSQTWHHVWRRPRSSPVQERAKKKYWDECKCIYFRDVSGASTWIQRDTWISLITSIYISLEEQSLLKICPSN